MLKARIEFDALGTRWWIDLPKQDHKLKNKIINKVNDFESKYTRFKTTSLLYELNKNKIFNNPSKEFLDLVEFGLKMYRATDGLFNISVGAKLESDGYGKVTTPGSIISTNLLDDIKINDHKIEISSTTTLDFGGFGKGWLIDKIGRIIRDQGVTNFIINGGGDILVGDEPQEILIEHPLNPGFSIKTIILKNQALASSSMLKRVWKDKAGTSKTHIINTSKSKNDPEFLSAHVMANTALLADSLATIMLIADDKLRRLLSKNFDYKFFGVV